jgi:hypothetical protein
MASASPGASWCFTAAYRDAPCRGRRLSQLREPAGARAGQPYPTRVGRPEAANEPAPVTLEGLNIGERDKLRDAINAELRRRAGLASCRSS